MVVRDLPHILEIERLSFPSPWPGSSFIGEIENLHISFPNVIIYKFIVKLVSYVIFWHGQEKAQISNIAVHPDFRERGLGKAVLDCTIEMMIKKGAKHVLLEVRSSNLPARSLYYNFRFELLGVKQDYYFNPTEDALVMIKYLSEP